ncbi:MAG: aminoacyl-tRNA hydrolase [Acidimicrobiaceae bacterium]|nr:aminoacyl-tRNA hydrolase [Acidimicrobiaceae bacterium]
MALRRSVEGGRRGSASTLVIVGLANPGEEFAGSRHNVGGDAVRLLAQRRGAKFSLERRQRAVIATITSPGGTVTLAVPTTYMNESGAALPPLLARTSLEDFTRLVVVHDDLDLEPGRLQLRFAGGLAGHNGLRSITQVLGTQDFARLRIGIGRPARKEQVTDHVLKRPTGTRRTQLETDVAEAADALEVLVDSGFDIAQRQINAGRD